MEEIKISDCYRYDTGTWTQSTSVASDRSIYRKLFDYGLGELSAFEVWHHKDSNNSLPLYVCFLAMGAETIVEIHVHSLQSLISLCKEIKPLVSLLGDPDTQFDVEEYLYNE